MGAGALRVQKTKAALRHALSWLLWCRKPEEITIRELTEAAGIHRNTFFAHYADVNALLLELQDTILQELDDLLPPGNTTGSLMFYTILTNHLYRNGEFFRVFFRDSQFSDRFSTLLTKKLSDGKPDLARQFQLTFRVRGILGVLRKWIDANFSCPQYDIAHLLCQLDKQMKESTK